SALKLKRRPPFTTFATRLMWMTRSVRSSSELGSMISCCAMKCLSEAQARLAGRVGERLDAPVIEEAVPIEDDLLDALLLARLGDGLAHRLRVRDLGALLALHVLGERGG